LQTPVALITGALIFVVLSFSMFGFYELKLPSAVENYFFNWSNRFKGGHLLSDFLMGAISALIISPCVAAPLAGALLYISQTHDVTLGAVALFSLSLGMGIPLLLIGASAGTFLPKAGEWMNAVRRLFGVLMLGVAIWIISPVLPSALQLLLWAALCIVPAIYLRAIDPLPATAGSSQRVFKGFAVILLLYGIALLMGAWSGARSPLQPLQNLTASAHHGQSLAFKRIHSVQELQQVVSAANGKPVMLDFYADWCVSCKEYEQFVFTDPQVQAALKDVVLLQADVTDNREQDAALLKHFALFGPPGIVFFNPQGQALEPIIKGYQDASKFLDTLRALKLRPVEEASHA
jgi:thiol:disulfide interchange protein DsbD